VSAFGPTKNMKQLSESLADAISRLANKVFPVVVRWLKSFKKWFKDNKEELRAIGRQAGTVVVTAFRGFKGILQTVWRILKFVFNRIKDGIRIFWSLVRAVKGAVKAIGNAFSGIKDKAEDVIKNFKDVWTGLPGWLKGAAADAARGFVEGFTRVKIPDWIVKIVKGGFEKLEKWGQKGSPWRRTDRMGREAGQGFVNGLAWASGGVEDATRGWSDAIRRGTRETSRAAVDMAEASFGAAKDAARDASVGLAKPLTQAAEQGRKAARALQESIRGQNNVRAKGARRAVDIERDSAQQIAKIQDKAAKQQLEVREKAQKDSLRIEKNYARATEENQKDAARFQEMTARNAERQTGQINRAFEKINQRAVAGGATQAQLQAIEEDRTRRLEEVSKAANDSIERSQKDAAKAQRSLERQRDKELRRISKQAHKQTVSIEKQQAKQIQRLEKEKNRKLVANSRDTKEKLARIAKDSAKQQKNLAERQLRETRRFHDKQLREEKQHRVRRDRTRNIGLGRPRQNITQFETPRRIPQRTEELRRLADSNRDQERRRRSIVQQARSPESPGGKAITASEMDKIMDKHTKRSEARMRQAARLTQFNPQWWAAVDEGASKSFDHFTDMKPDAR
jgi:hypothetical protein